MHDTPGFIHWSLRALGAAPLALALTGCSHEVPVGVLPDVAPALPNGASIPGACDPSAPAGVSVLAGDLDADVAPLHLAGDVLYVAHRAGVTKVPLAGGAPALLTTANPYPGQRTPLDLVVIGSSVHVLAVSGVFSVPTAGGEPTVRHVFPKLQGPDEQLAADSVSLYWTESRPSDSSNPAEGVLMTMLVDGGSPMLLTSIGVRFLGLVVDDRDLFWTQPDEPLGGRVRAMPKGGGERATIAADHASPAGMALSGDRLFWRNHLTAMTAPKEGGAATSFGAGEAPVGSMSYGARGVAINATNIHWFEDTFNAETSTSATGARLMRAPLSGGPAEVVAALSTPPMSRPIACPGGVCWTQLDDETWTVSVRRYNHCP